MTDRMSLEKATVLGGLIYFVNVRRKYVTLVSQIERIVDTQRSAYQSAESCLSVLIRADENVKPEYLMKMLVQQYNRLPPADQAMRKSYIELLEQLDNRDMFTEDLCMRLLEELVQAKAIRALQEGIAQPGSVRDKEKIITTFNEVVSAIRKHPEDEIRIWHPLEDMEDLLLEKPRTPTGVSIIDKILAGGVALGEHTGILGPSGGGKSTLANMLQCNLAIRKYNTLLIQTEQTISGDITNRMYSYMLGVHTSSFLGKSLKEIDPALIQRIKELKPVWDRLRCVSIADKTAKTSHESNEVVEIIQRVMDTGFTPQFVILDWLGKLVLNFMHGGDKQFNEKAEELKNTLNAFFRANNISAFYLHQTDTQTQSREPAYKPTKNDADRYHSFANDLENCICMGTSTKFDDGIQVAWVGADKARMMASGKYLMAKIDGGRACMTECEDGEYALNAKGQFQSMRELIGVSSSKPGIRKAESVYVPPEGSADAFMQENY